LPEGTLAVGVGLVISGITAYGFLVLSARVLGKDDYAPLSLLWAMVFLAGPGFFLPLEQEVTRALSARRARGQGAGPLIRRAAIVGGVLAAVLVLAALVFAPVLLDELFDNQVLLLAGFILGMVGYYCEHLSRGTLSGLGRFRPYSVILGAEGGLRLLAAAILAVVGVKTAGPYGLLVGLAPFAAVAVALRGEHDLVTPGPDAPFNELSSRLGALLLGSVMAQSLLFIGPLAMQVLATTDAQEKEVGRFQLGLVMARVPLFLFQAIQAALLPKLSALATAGRIDEFRVGFKRLFLVVLAIGIIATVGGFVAGPFVMRLVFGPDFDLGSRTMGMLALSSALFMLAIAMAQAVIALHGHVQMAISWVLGVVTFFVVTALGTDLFLRVELGLVLGCAVAAVCMGAVGITLIRRGAPVDVGDLLEAIHDVPLEP
jgi:O-antigen/teichoic acid export membrane protein